MLQRQDERMKDDRLTYILLLVASVVCIPILVFVKALLLLGLSPVLAFTSFGLSVASAKREKTRAGVAWAVGIFLWALIVLVLYAGLWIGKGMEGMH